MDRPAFRWIYPFELPVIAYAVVGLLCSRAYGFPIHWEVALDFSYDLLLLREVGRYSLVVLLAVYLRRRWGGGERREIIADLSRAVRGYLQPWKDWRRWLELGRAVLAIKLCVAVFTHLKQAIPLMNPALYDRELWAIDQTLHLGVSPTHASLSLFSSPWLCRPLDALYVLWYTVKIPFLVWFVFFAPARRSWHFLSCYLLMWSLGGAFAAWFPSLGPIYTDPALFAGLDIPFARGLQERLWVSYQSLLADPSGYQVHLYDGVAAFPSLHVGFMALFTISVMPRRRLFWAMAAFTASIEVGSVVLGWHYAVDGYFTTLLALALWFGLDPLFREPAAPAAETSAPQDVNQAERAAPEGSPPEDALSTRAEQP